jgi:hypothetical protein
MLRAGVARTSAALAVIACAGLAAGVASASNPSNLGLAQPPYLGVKCSGPYTNWTGCGRVGIAVWVKRGASSIEAQLVGSTVRLDAPPRTARGRDYWQGFVHLDLRRLGLPDQWFGTEPYKVLDLRLTVKYGSRLERGMVRVTLHPGWG